VQVVKYRSKVFDNEQIINFLKEQIQGIKRTFEDEVIYIGLDKDHLYINAPLNILRARPGLPLEPVDRKPPIYIPFYEGLHSKFPGGNRKSSPRGVDTPSVRAG